MTLDEKYDKLVALLKEMRSVVIGFSGGVDSTFLAYAAYAALGNQAIAVTAVSATLPKKEAGDARNMAGLIGLSHRFVTSHEFDDDRFVKNPVDRCYFCKKIRFTALVELAREEGFNWVIDGGNVDDLGDYRPGLKALAELQQSVRSPMIEAGLHKADIRALSKRFGLPTWDKQSAACLASRIPYGTELTAERLEQVDKAETYVSAFVKGALRVRHHGSIARIEVGEADMPAILANRDDITECLRFCGFTHVVLDLAGYEMGSLNQDIRVGKE